MNSGHLENRNILAAHAQFLDFAPQTGQFPRSFNPSGADAKLS
jgi:hypothetical protein